RHRRQLIGLKRYEDFRGSVSLVKLGLVKGEQQAARLRQLEIDLCRQPVRVTQADVARSVRSKILNVTAVVRVKRGQPRLDAIADWNIDRALGVSIDIIQSVPACTLHIQIAAQRIR